MNAAGNPELRFWENARRRPAEVVDFYRRKVAELFDDTRSVVAAVDVAIVDHVATLRRLRAAEKEISRSFLARWPSSRLDNPTYGTATESISIVKLEKAVGEIINTLQSSRMPLFAGGQARKRTDEHVLVTTYIRLLGQAQYELVGQIEQLARNRAQGNDQLRDRLQQELAKVDLPAGIADGTGRLSDITPGAGPLVVQVGVIGTQSGQRIKGMANGNLAGQAYGPPLGIPALVDLELDGGFVTNHRETVVWAALRLLALVPTGHLELMAFDPNQLGSSLDALNDLSREAKESLLGGQARVEPGQLRELLNEQLTQITSVTQNYLGTRFGSLREYNESAGEVSIPYRILMLFDYPSGFESAGGHIDSDLVDKVQRIITAGPKAGVFTFVHMQAGQPASIPSGPPWLYHEVVHAQTPNYWPRSVLGYLPPINLESELGRGFLQVRDGLIKSGAADLLSPIAQFAWHSSPEQHDRQDVSRLLIRLQRDLASAPGVQVDPETVAKYTRQVFAERGKDPQVVALPSAPATWWQRSSTEDVTAAIGRIGERGIAEVVLTDADTNTSLLVAGAQGSGKSVLLHALICDLAMNYSPRELQFYLLDPKHGVEFKPYARYALPQAAMITINSEAECTLGILEDLANKRIPERGKRFTAAGVAKFRDYRRAIADDPGANPMPRIVIVIDEFQRLFEEDDALSLRASVALERLIKLGRSFGVHLVLGTQQLAGMRNSPHALTLIIQRIALMQSDQDSRAVLGDRDGGAALLRRSGQGIMKDQHRGCQELQTTYQSHDDIKATLSAMPSPAGAHRVRPPTVVDLAGQRLPSAAAIDTMTGPNLTIPIGIKYGLDPCEAIELSREHGRNILLVAPESFLAGDITGAASLIGMALATAVRRGVEVEVADLTASGSKLHIEVDRLRQQVTGGQPISFSRPGVLGLRLDGWQQEIEQRESVGGHPPDRIIVVADAHRMLAQPEPEELTERWKDLLVRGPVVGVHFVVTVPNKVLLQKLVGYTVTEYFGSRLVSRVSDDDALAVVGTYSASKLADCELLAVDYSGAEAKTTPFSGLPDSLWSALEGMRRT